MDVDVLAKVDDDNVVIRVLEAIEDVVGSATSVEGERKAHLRSLWTMPRRWR